MSPAPYLDLDAVPTGGEPACTFKFMDREWHTRPKDDVPWGLIEGFLAAQASGDEAQIIVQIGPFFEAVMDPDEVEDFMELTEESDALTIKRFQELLTFVAESVFGKVPTQRSSSSRGGSRSTARSSRGSSPSPELESSTA